MDITSKCYMCIQWTLVICYLVITQQSNLLYTDIDLKLRNKSHGTVHYKIGVTCIYNGHVFYTPVNSPCNEFTSFWSICYLVITQQSDLPIS